MSLEASAPAFSMWTVGGSGGLSCKVSGPQKRPKRRINASPGKRCVESSSCSRARAASPWSGNATLSTTSRAAFAALVALSKFAAPSRRTRLFASSDPADRSVRKLTTICGRARRATSAKAGSRRRRRQVLLLRDRGEVATCRRFASIRGLHAERGEVALSGRERRSLLRRGSSLPGAKQIRRQFGPRWAALSGPAPLLAAA